MRQTCEVVARIAAIRAPANVVLVTHHVNILALAGAAVVSGEAVLVRPAGGSVQTLGRLVLRSSFLATARLFKAPADHEVRGA